MKKFTVLLLCSLLFTSAFSTGYVSAETGGKSQNKNVKVNTSGYTTIGGVKSVDVKGSEVILSLEDGHKTKLSFLDENLFRYYVNIKDEQFRDYPATRAKDHEATIVENNDKDVMAQNKVKPVIKDGDIIEIKTNSITVLIEKETSKLSVKNAKGDTVMEEVAPIMFKDGETVQSLSEGKDEFFFGGGTQNGRFSHKGHVIKAARDNNWVDGGVASPNPFYWSTNGYGILRNTFYEGEYDFGSTKSGLVQTKHSENRFDSYIFVGNTPTDILNSYTNLTGKPAELPDYGFYLSHLNCYNRDAWAESPNGNKVIDGKKYIETNRGGKANEGEYLESLLTKGDNHPFTAQRQIELHEEHDLPIGWILPNDGYGCGYGQTDSLDGDIEELKQFVDFANAHGLEVGLWTQSNLWPKDPANPQKGERDIRKEVEKAGVRAVKTDVAWVGAGYSMALDGVMKAYDAITELGNSKPAIVSLNGWGGTQRYAGIWSGDQSGGNWEYIRFHIPTYIGTGLSGMPYVGSDMDGIFGGKNPVIQTRDFQWKAFTPYMLDMDGWGSSQKNPWEFGEPNTSINRAYLKMKAEMMPYIATASKFSSETGVPMVRAMLFEEMNSYTLGKETQYQFMWGDDILVAPIYKNTKMDKDGNDVRNNIYLPETSNVWIDYLTGEQYRGGRVLNDFDAPVWKTPVFVRNGAIIPMYSENNNPRPVSETNPKGLDKSIRRAEVFPFETSKFEVYEDDGITFEGSGMRTLYSSVVKNNNATITLGKPEGKYDGVVEDRSHEVIVNVSEAPKGVKGKVNGKDVDFKAVSSLEEYEKAEGNVYFYNESPLAIVSKYATKDTDFDKNPVTRRPQVFVKSTEKVNIFNHEFSITVEGFKNDGELNIEELNKDLDVPNNLKALDVTDSQISLTWNEVEGAETYDVEVDGVIVSNLKSNNFIDEDLDYSTDYTYRVRAVSKKGFSEWSEKIVVKTAEDPYRNVPKNMKASWTGNGSYTGTPDDAIDLDFASQFHSKNDAIGSEFIIDMQLVYEMDKFEYVPRQDNFGNGTLNQFDLDYSIDGIHWKTAVSVGPEDEWKWPSAAQDELVTKTLELDGISARFLKIVPKKTVGNFFTTFELLPYTKEGKPAYPSGDANYDGVLTENDLVQFENYMGLKLGDADFGTEVDIGHAGRQDFNFNGVIDVYDVHYTAHQINGGAKKTGPVEGKLQIVPDKETAKKGDVVTYNIYGLGMENVNAFGIIFDLDRELHVINEKTAAQLTALTSHMSDFSQRRIHTDGSASFSLVATNVGENDRLSGSEVLATFKLEFKEDVEDTTLNIVDSSLVGSDLSIVDGIFEGEPTLPDPVKILGISDIKSLTFINEELNKDVALEDGYSENGKILFQQENYADLLFDGDKTTEAEFKWFMDENSFGPEVKLPTDFIIELKEAHPVTRINVVNRPNKSNGRVTKISAKAYIGDKEIDLGTLDEKDVFTFNIPKNLERIDGLIDKLVITPLESRGNTSFPDGNNENRMLTLQEIEIVTDATTEVEDIEIKISDEVYLDSFTKVDVIVKPENASNPLVNIVSDNPDVATVQRIVTETGYDYYLIAHKAGTVTLTANSLSDESITSSKEIKIINSIDKSRLENAIKQAEALSENLYTEESFAKFTKILDESKQILEKVQSPTEVVNQTIKLRDAMKELELKGSDSSRPDSENLIDSELLKVKSATNHADKDYPENVLDKNENTIWHTGYQSDDQLPVDIVIDLGSVYALEQIDMLARQNSRNGHISHYRIETSMDGENYKPIVSGYFEHDGNRLINPEIAKQIKFAPTKARYVKFIALESLGDTKNKYASIAELSFYGIAEKEIYAESIEFAEDNLSVNINQEVNLKPIVNPENYNEELTWTSDNEDVVSVNKGLIKGISSGKATITVSGKNANATIEVTVKSPLFNDLEELIKGAEEKLDQLHPFIKEKLISNINVAKLVDEEATEAEIKKAYDELDNSIKQAFVDNEVMEQFVDYMKYDLKLYDENSTKDFKNVLLQAEKLLETGIESLEEVQNLNAKFEESILKLEKLDYSKLETLIDVLSSIDVSNTTKSSKDTYNKSLENAREVLKSSSSNKEINSAYEDLKEQFEGLIFTASKDVIKALEIIEETLNKINLEQYKDESQKAISDLKTEISKALAKEELLEEEASILLDNAKDVLSKLEEKEEPIVDEKPGDSDNNSNHPGETDTGSKDDVPTTNDNSENDSDENLSNENESNVSPETNEDLPSTGIALYTNIIGYIFVMLGTITVFFKRIKREH